jgi:SAM-dependent methyltransferase
MNALLNYDLDSGYRNQCLMDKYFCSIVNTLFEAESDAANRLIGNDDSQKRARQVEADGGWKCIHLGIRDFIREIQFVVKELKLTPEQIGRMRFLDVGCGVGQKVFMAGCFGFRAYGLELRKELIAAGESLFRRLDLDTYESNRFIQGNALTYPDYNAFDILYFYCPLFKQELEMEMEKKLATDAKPGTIVIANLSAYFGRRDEFSKDKMAEGWKRLEFNNGYGNIFQKL